MKVFTDRFPPHYKGQSNRQPGFYLHEVLHQNLELGKKSLKKDFDLFICVDGSEGSGKSVLAIQIGYYLDPTLTMNRITFTPQEFKNAVHKGEKFQCIIYDEAYTGLSSRRTMSETNHMLVEMMAEVRQKNLIIILVLPAFFDLDKYAAIHRTRCLIHVYHKMFHRGYFNFYGYEKKKNLYLLGKKTYNYKKVKPNFSGYFAKFYPINEEDYKKKKLDSLSAKIEESDKVLETNSSLEALYLLKKYYKMDNDHLRMLAKLVGRGERYFINKLREVEKGLKKDLKSKIPDDTNRPGLAPRLLV